MYRDIDRERERWYPSVQGSLQIRIEYRMCLEMLWSLLGSFYLLVHMNLLQSNSDNALEPNFSILHAFGYNLLRHKLENYLKLTWSTFRVWIQVHINIHVCTHTHTCTYAQYTYVYTYASTYTYTYAYASTYTYTHAHTHMHSHIVTHAHTHPH